jgi:hypothetical protein
VRFARLSLALCILLVAAGACEAPPRAAESTDSVLVSDSAGVRMVRNDRSGRWGNGPPRVTEILRIGVVDGDAARQFYRISHIVVAPDGTLYVVNGQTQSIRVFTPDGAFVREFGRKGKGPGEYDSIVNAWLAGDVLVVSDWQPAGRHGLYSPDGELLAFWTFHWPDARIVTPRASAGSTWLATLNPGGSATPAPGDSAHIVSWLVRFNPSSQETGDTLLGITSTMYGRPDGSPAAPLFAGSSRIGFDAAGNAFITNRGTYRIDEFDPRGNHKSAILREFDPVALTAQDVQALRDRIIARYDTMTARGEAGRMRDWFLRLVDDRAALPPRLHMPPLGRLLVSWDGSFWVERIDGLEPGDYEYANSFGEDAPRSSRWDFFDAAGRFLTTVNFTLEFAPLAVRGNEVTGVFRDEMDVEHVVTLRIEPA